MNVTKILVIISFVLLTPLTHTAADPTTGPLVGALRWDGWNAGQNWPDGSPNDWGIWSELILTPPQWRYRLPFYSTISATGAVQIRLDSQQKMDQEIAYAKAGGLDYWAFDFYGNNGPFGDALQRYRASSRKSDMKFALVVAQWPAGTPNRRTQIVNHMADPQYVTVLGGRPLLYFFTPDPLTASDISGLRSAAMAIGLPNPYLVLMTWNPNDGRTTALGFDAISAYASAPTGPVGAVPYSNLAAENQAVWNAGKSNGLKVVPIVNTGWDPQPVWEGPPPPGSAGSGPGATAIGTPTEIASNLQSAFDWMAANPSVAEPNAVIMYAWNEFSEGGWLAPLAQSGSARLDAIRRVIPNPPSTDIMPPVVVVTAPAYNSTVQNTATVSADAFDNVGVSGVQFKLDGADLQPEDTSPPFSISWNLTNVPSGPHTLSALARDAAGNQTASVPIIFTVTPSTCDVNQDESVNVFDVQLGVNQVLEIIACVPAGNPGSADINQDGRCTVLDLQRILNPVLGGQCVTGP